MNAFDIVMIIINIFSTIVWSWLAIAHLRHRFHPNRWFVTVAFALVALGALYVALGYFE